MKKLSMKTITLEQIDRIIDRDFNISKIGSIEAYHNLEALLTGNENNSMKIINQKLKETIEKREEIDNKLEGIINQIHNELTV